MLPGKDEVTPKLDMVAMIRDTGGATPVSEWVTKVKSINSQEHRQMPTSVPKSQTKLLPFQSWNMPWHRRSQMVAMLHGTVAVTPILEMVAMFQNTNVVNTFPDMVAIFQDTDEAATVPDMVADLQSTNKVTGVPAMVPMFQGTVEVNTVPDMKAMSRVNPGPHMVAIFQD